MKYYVVITDGCTTKRVETYQNEITANERVKLLNDYYMAKGINRFAHIWYQIRVATDARGE